MATFDDAPLHDFPDRAIRQLLEDPANLRELIAVVLPALVDRFDFARREILPRAFLLDDWRKRESDMLFRLPFHEAEQLPPALVCLLVEHQSTPRSPLPQRTLVYAALYWEQEWKAWEAGHDEGTALRLTPVIPIVFHTGTTRWNTARTLAELIGGPEEIRVYAPGWSPLFLDVAEQTPAEWLANAGEWMATLAVVRAERADAAAFRQVYSAVLQRLQLLGEREPVRWHELLRFVLAWGLRRRPAVEGDDLLLAARESQTDLRLREEVQKMSETLGKTRDEEVFEQGQLRNCREILRMQLEERFGSLPDTLVARIEQTNELDRLRGAARQIVHLSTLEDLRL